MKTLQEVYGEYLASRINATADRFRHVADKLAAMAESVPDIGQAGNADAGSLAQRAIHEIVWGIANASPDSIVSAATDYDRNVTRAIEA